MLKERVSSCRELWLIDLPEGNSTFWDYCLDTFLENLKDSVVLLRCQTRWQPAVIEFLSLNTKLRDLILFCVGYGKSWDWSGLQRCDSVKRLFFHETRLTSSRAEEAITKFPNINQVLLPGNYTSFYAGPRKSHWSAQNYVTDFKGTTMISASFLRSVLNISLTIITFETLDQFIEALPQLQSLIKLKLTLSSYIFDSLAWRDLDGNEGVSLSQLCGLVEKIKTLQQLFINDVRNRPHREIDNHFLKRLSSLPESISEVTLKEKPLRPPADTNKWTIDMNFQ
jgi:hypothetical protein